VTADFWDKRAGIYDDEIQKHEDVYDQTIARVKSLLSASDVVLDLGCASGEFSLDIAPFVQSVHGIDPSTNMIALATKKAKNRAVDNVTFAPADVFDRSLDAHRYTAVLAFSVLHLVDDMHPVLRRINDLLAARGVFVSQTPCMSERSFLFQALVGLAQRVNLAPTIRTLTFVEHEAAIAGAGFDITESEVWDHKSALEWIVARKK
jgi:2-polyprenyl-3-methyl-5-hydroxy-6-metoxy-1,4-benzoquinol methylase